MQLWKHLFFSSFIFVFTQTGIHLILQMLQSHMAHWLIDPGWDPICCSSGSWVSNTEKERNEVLYLLREWSNNVARGKCGPAEPADCEEEKYVNFKGGTIYQIHIVFLFKHFIFC